MHKCCCFQVQLCLAPNTEISSCSLDLLSNSVCDTECHNSFCHKFAIGSDFNEQTTSSVDMYQCPWPPRSNDTNSTALAMVDESTMNCSSGWQNENPYLDPNVSPNDYPSYGYCWNDWINDGECQDGCRYIYRKSDYNTTYLQVFHHSLNMLNLEFVV